MSTHVHDVDPDEEATHTDEQIVARDTQALTLVKALDQADEHQIGRASWRERV